jgi:hypothetical protein
MHCKHSYEGKGQKRPENTAVYLCIVTLYKENTTAENYLVLYHLVLENVTVFVVLGKVRQLA